MNRVLIFVLLITVLWSACVLKKSTGPDGQSQPAGQSQPTTGGDGAGSTFAASAAKIKDACTVMPADLVQKIVPGASAPQSSQYPTRCSVSNGKSVLEITIETGIITPT